MNQQNISQYTKLNSGYDMPRLTLGTANTDTVEQSVYNAIKLGYRSIDTATMYQNEEKIGNAISRCIKENIVKRQDLFITTKVQSEDKQNIQGAIEFSLKKLQLDYVDLYLVHWPGGYFDSDNKYHNTPMHIVWQEMEKLVQLKLTRSIGICNFQVQMIVDLMSYAKIKPAVNQIELHPYFQQKEVQYTCQLFGIQICCYSSLARGGKREKDGKIINIFEENIIKKLVEKYQKTPSQIVLNWHLQNNILNPVARSENEERLKQNLNIFDIQMDKNDIEEINNLDCNCRMVLSKQKYGLDYFA